MAEPIVVSSAPEGSTCFGSDNGCRYPGSWLVEPPAAECGPTVICCVYHVGNAVLRVYGYPEVEAPPELTEHACRPHFVKLDPELIGDKPALCERPNGTGFGRPVVVCNRPQNHFERQHRAALPNGQVFLWT